MMGMDLSSTNQNFIPFLVCNSLTSKEYKFNGMKNANTKSLKILFIGVTQKQNFYSLEITLVLSLLDRW